MAERAISRDSTTGESPSNVTRSDPATPAQGLLRFDAADNRRPEADFSNASDRPPLTLVMPDDPERATDGEAAEAEVERELELAAPALALADELATGDTPARPAAQALDIADLYDGTPATLSYRTDDDAPDGEADATGEDPAEARSTPATGVFPSHTVMIAAPGDSPRDDATLPRGEREASARPTAEAPAPAPMTTADLTPISRPSRFIPPDSTARPTAAELVARHERERAKSVAALRESAASEPSPMPTDPSPDVRPVAPATDARDETPPARKDPPKRVGSGQLQNPRLNWRPGAPFGDGPAQTQTRFRWELMLTTACGTAACGLVGIWLLRTLLS